MASDHDRPARSRHWLRMALAVPALALAALLAVAAWLVGTESGARTALSALAGAAGVVRIDGVHGRLASPLQLDRIELDRPGQRITLRDVRLDWRPAALLHGLLHVESLRIGQLAITGKIRQKPEPARMPDNIALPIALQLDSAQVDGGTIGWGALDAVRLGAFAFRLDFDRRRYRLQLHRLTAQSDSGGAFSGNAGGQATLDTVKPYALHAELTGGGAAVIERQTIAANGRIVIDGSLARLAASADFAAGPARVRGKAVLQPFSEPVLASADLAAQALNLSAFSPKLPHSALDGTLTVAENGRGRLALTNRGAGLYNENQVPLAALRAELAQSGGKLQVERMTAALGSARQPAGTVSGSGSYGDGALTLALAVDALDLRRLDGRLQPTRLDGSIDIRHAGGKQQFALDPRQPVGKQRASLVAGATLADAQLAVEHAELRLGDGRISASARVDFAGEQRFSAEGKVSRFRLQDVGRFTELPALDLNGSFSLSGARQPRLTADLSFRIDDSRLAGRVLQGDGQVQLRADRLLVPKLLLIAGDNRLDAHGELSHGDAELSFALAAPRLDQLGPGFAGALNASGKARGTLAQPHVTLAWQGANLRAPGQLQADSLQGQADIVVNRARLLPVDSASADLSARNLKRGADRLGTLAARVQFASRTDAPLALDLRAEGIVTPQWQAENFIATAQGTTAQHAIHAALTESGQKQRWTLDAGGGLRETDRAPRWQGTIERFDAAGRFAAHLASPAALSVSPQRVQLDRFRLDADAASIAIEQFARDAQGIATRGRIDRLQLAQVLKFTGAQPALGTDLQLAGEWDITIGDTLKGSAQLRRTGGDVTLHGGGTLTLGLSRLEATATAANGHLDVRLDADGRQLGHIGAALTADTGNRAGRFGIASDTRIAGTAAIDTPSLAWVGPLVSPTVTSGGSLQGRIAIGGTLAQPLLTGQIAGGNLRLYIAELGLDLRNGTLDSAFQGDTLLVKDLSFRNGDGSITASGPIGFANGITSAQLALRANRFLLLNRSDRKLVISGASQVAWDEGHARMTGALQVNSGFFDIGRADMPQLSDDVVVAGREEKAGSRLAASLDLDIDLGENVRLKGRGLDGTLAGRIRLTSEPRQPLRAQGTVRIAKGTYAAYGRELAIEQGVLRFGGPLNNPALDILAMRRGQEVEAGVAVRGSALAPRVALVSEPTVPDVEKLSWLVLGRGLDTAGAGDIGALQGAASALLSQSAAAGVQSQIASAFGLDTLSVGTSQDTLQQRIVTLGKRISSRLYVSYQQSLQTATSVILLRYTLSPHLALEAEAGARSALSLFYNIAFD